MTTTALARSWLSKGVASTRLVFVSEPEDPAGTWLFDCHVMPRRFALSGGGFGPESLALRRCFDSTWTNTRLAECPQTPIMLDRGDMAGTAETASHSPDTVRPGRTVVTTESVTG